ncbi:MAG: hypothetical protein WDN28_33275 [Chthoniobacter sp.]
MQALQSAARNAAAAGANNLGRNPVNGLQLPNIPNGLAPGGSWSIRACRPIRVCGRAPCSPNRPLAAVRRFVDVKQTAPQAILNWQTFNIGKKTLLKFDQDGRRQRDEQWVAFNKINDPTVSLPRFLGSIQGERAGLRDQPQRHHLRRVIQVNTHIFVGFLTSRSTTAC